jgi:uncharacterized lipoprotein YmbA
MRCTVLILAASFLPSCGVLSPRPDGARWFVLATIEELDPERARAEPAGHSLGLGPLSFSDYLLRPELVSRRGATRVVPIRDDLWAEPLDEAVARVLASDLAFLTGARAVPYPWFAAEAPEARVRIAFERFELEEHARAVLVATWILEDESGNALGERRTRVVRDLADPDTGGALELSRCLAELGLEIAGAWSASAGGVE